ncbi:hypothetical protein [Maridesulfovibrio sp.]|uniref:ABC-type transport auxiliary lipoprotein family protein n=1 Tax=Maridesulfovibrio sp. TaxID=2795000 RepID=UPI002A18A5D8|nr:hypothetical protein [Maridesulfovibrio sp.]
MRDYLGNSNILQKAAVLLLILGITAISGCVKLERPSLERKYFTIDIPRDKAEPKKPESTTNLTIRRVKISPRYEDRNLVYKTGPNSFESDYYNAFFITPAAMMTQELHSWMSDSGLFANVLGPESMGTGNLILEGVVNAIYGDYSSDPHKAILKMQFFLLDNENPGLPIIYSRNFSRAIELKDTEAKTLVSALNCGAKEIFTELERDLSETVAKK